MGSMGGAIKADALKPLEGIGFAPSGDFLDARDGLDDDPNPAGVAGRDLNYTIYINSQPLIQLE